jgi:hypothetical protein
MVPKCFGPISGSGSHLDSIWCARSPLMGRATHFCINITPTTIPTMNMAQAETLNCVLVELTMKYSPRSAIPKLPAAASFAT